MKNLTGIEMAFLEANGEGSFELCGKAVKFHSGGYTYTFWSSTTKQAATLLHVLRAAPKHFA